MLKIRSAADFNVSLKVAASILHLGLVFMISVPGSRPEAYLAQL